MVDDDVAIRVHDLHKSFEIAENKSTSIKQLFVNAGKKNRKHKQKVLDGIDFEIKKGEFFGIVGRNGSGKSTLLKILAGVYAPDSGAVIVNGNLTPFIELGVGFNPELSGKDNVYLSASLLGYPRKVVDEMYDEIVDFAELHEHMDKKLKNYSSGMQVRLAFSIAIKAKNDILIFDEVLAVGDAAFQQKCMAIFEDYRRNKQTVILVTHSMENIRSLCTRALMLSDGKIDCIGGVRKVAAAYVKINEEHAAAEAESEEVAPPASKISLVGGKKSYNLNDTMNLKISWAPELAVAKVGVAITGSANENVFGSTTAGMVISGTSIDYSVKLNLGSGHYFVHVLLSNDIGKIIEIGEKAWEFSIAEDYSVEHDGLTNLEYSYNQPNKKGIMKGIK